jgi:hypothetical protein
MLAFLLALQPLVIAIAFLGRLRALMPTIAISRIGDVALPHGISLGLIGAVAALTAWGAATLGLGAWKTATREI